MLKSSRVSKKPQVYHKIFILNQDNNIVSQEKDKLYVKKNLG